MSLAGSAIKEFWGVDADTVVFVADPGLGNILNFNVGGNVDLMVPSVSNRLCICTLLAPIDYHHSGVMGVRNSKSYCLVR